MLASRGPPITHAAWPPIAHAARSPITHAELHCVAAGLMRTSRWAWRRVQVACLAMATRKVLLPFLRDEEVGALHIFS